MYSFWIYHSMNSDKWIHHHNQGTEYFYHWKNYLLPLPSLFSSPTTDSCHSFVYLDLSFLEFLIKKKKISIFCFFFSQRNFFLRFTSVVFSVVYSFLLLNSLMFTFDGYIMIFSLYKLSQFINHFFYCSCFWAHFV